jgi:hypothetical protein
LRGQISVARVFSAHIGACRISSSGYIIGVHFPWSQIGICQARVMSGKDYPLLLMAKPEVPESDAKKAA